MNIKIVSFVILLVFLSSCTYVKTSPKAIGYFIIEDVKNSNFVMDTFDQVTTEMDYNHVYTEYIPLKNFEDHLRRHEYIKNDESFRFFFSNFSGLRCITIGIYTDLPVKSADKELEKIKNIALETYSSMVFTAENCNELENNTSIFDRNTVTLRQHSANN